MYVTRNLESYKKFMGIEEMPDFKIDIMEITLEKAKQKGYGVPTSHFYNVGTDKHILKDWKDIYKSSLQADYILFHEFTHMYDKFTYSAKDKSLYASNRGFTEYHASQVELLKLFIMHTWNIPLNPQCISCPKITSNSRSISQTHP
jgi:hypothetical protein